MSTEKGGLPDYCKRIDEVFAQIAERQGRTAEEVKQAVLMNIEAAR